MRIRWILCSFNCYAHLLLRFCCMCLLNEKENREKRHCFTRVFSFFFFCYPDCEDSMKKILKKAFLSTALLFLLVSLLSSCFFLHFLFSLLLILLVCAVTEGVVATLVSMPFYPSVAFVLMLEQLDTISEEDYLRTVSFIISTIPYGVVFCYTCCIDT